MTSSYQLRARKAELITLKQKVGYTKADGASVASVITIVSLIIDFALKHLVKDGEVMDIPPFRWTSIHKHILKLPFYVKVVLFLINIVKQIRG